MYSVNYHVSLSHTHTHDHVGSSWPANITHKIYSLQKMSHSHSANANGTAKQKQKHHTHIVARHETGDQCSRSQSQRASQTQTQGRVARRNGSRLTSHTLTH